MGQAFSYSPAAAAAAPLSASTRLQGAVLDSASSGSAAVLQAACFRTVLQAKKPNERQECNCEAFHVPNRVI